jgi:hypothetical protein
MADSTRLSMNTAELLGQSSVKRWLEDYSRYWKNISDQNFKLTALARFCEFVGKMPDEMIADCLRDVEGGYKKIRGKRRRFYMEKIKEFEASIMEGNSRSWGNAVRSFFIHNGVAMSADSL